MCARPVHHWGYFLLASLGTEEAEKVRRSHLAESVADYRQQYVQNKVETFFGKFEFEGSYRSMLRTHAQAGAESVDAYAARTTHVCSKAYVGFSTETQLSLAVDHLIAGLADLTSPEYLLHDRACRPLSWQATVQMAQACEDSRILLHAPSTAAVAATTKAGEHSLDERTCAPAESTAARAWQQSARDDRAMAGAHSSRKQISRALASALKPSTSQQNSLPTAARDPPPYSKSTTAEISLRAFAVRRKFC